MKKLDFLSPLPTFYVDSENRHVSSLGGVLTLLTGMLFIGLTVFFGWDLFVREAPEISVSKAFNEFPHANQTDLVFATTVQYAGGFPIAEIERKLSFSVMMIDTDPSRPSDEISKYFVYDMKPCPETLYYKENRGNIQSGMIGPPENYFCPPDEMDYQVEGKFPSDKFKVVYFQATFCRNRDDCYSHDFIYKNLTSLYFHSLIKDSYVDSFDFEQPVKDSLYSILLPASVEFSRDFNVYLQEMNFFDEQGWVMAQKSQTKRYAVDSYTLSIDRLDQRKEIVGLAIGFGDFKQIYKRKYMKLQDVLAQVTGVAKGISLMFKLIILLYSHYSVNKQRMRERLVKPNVLMNILVGNPPAEENSPRTKEPNISNSFSSMKPKLENRNAFSFKVIDKFSSVYQKIFSEENLFEMCVLHEMNSEEEREKNRCDINKFLHERMKS